MLRLRVFGLLLCLTIAASADAQNTSQVFGKATDTSGAVLPGVTVTLSSPALLEPRVAVTSDTGTYEFSGLPIGVYAVKFELAGFGTLVREALQLQGGFNAQVNGELSVGALQENVVVTAVNPIVDVRSTTQGTRFNVEELQAIPSARDVFQVLTQTPGITSDRQNVGGTHNGQQIGMFSRGAANGQGRWFVDGVDRNDIANGRPFVIDFNSVEEVQVSTGGADATMQTPGVFVNVVSKSGSDALRGSTWFFRTDRALGSDNVTDELRREGANSGNPLVYTNDYGGQLGGPIKRGRAWFFATYGMQNVRLGVLNYYKPTAECAPVKANSLAYPFGDVVDCLNLNKQDVPALGSKFNLRPFTGNMFTVANSFGQRVETIRSADDLHPTVETTNKMTFLKRSDSHYDLGGPWWNTEIWDPSWKVGDQQSISDRWLVDVSFGHHCWCDSIVPQTDELRQVQPMLELTTGTWGRSWSDSSMMLVTNNTLDVTTSYFFPGRLGGDHSLKAGYKYGHYGEVYDRTYSGHGQSVFNSPTTLPIFSTPFTARVIRDFITPAFLDQNSVFLQDTYTRQRFTAIVGLRWDRQEDKVAAITVPAHAFQGQPTVDGTPFNLFPTLDVPEVRAGVVWNTVAPRLGLTYDLTGNATNVIKGSYAIYFDQRSAGQLSKALNPAGSARIDLGWSDLNSDQAVQVNEINQSLIRSVTGFDPANPSALVSANTVDPNVRGPRTNEIVIGFGKEMRGDFGFNASYVWRRYDNFIWNDTIGISSADYAAVQFTPAASACPAGARCETVTYYVPRVTLPSAYNVTNRPDFTHVYNGFELVIRKRSSRGWMLNGSYSYNTTLEYYDSAAAYEDPTDIDHRNGFQYAPSAGIGGGGGSNLAGIPINAKWIAKLNGSYRMPYDINVAATADMRQGYPFAQAVNIASRPNRAPAIAVMLDPLGSNRFTNFATMDLRLDRAFVLQGLKLLPSFDMFNVFNSNTVMGRRVNQNAANANSVFGILAPRIARVGLMVTF
jgi:Carboxypeptidase regulatory-like domain/TonB-dependent Receptor Plug Domain